jgi:hypothetical protein
MSATPTPQSDQAEELARKIVTAFEGHFREWMMPGEHAEAVKLTKEVIEDSLGATQAATTPGRAEELAAWLEAEARYQMAYGREETAGVIANAAALLRAQSSELLALRADKQRLDWLESTGPLVNGVQGGHVCHGQMDSSEDSAHFHGSNYREAIDAALNSPTQKSPAK